MRSYHARAAEVRAAFTSSRSRHALADAICGYCAHDQTQDRAPEHQQSDKDQAAMRVAAPLSGDDVAQGETDKAPL